MAKAHHGETQNGRKYNKWFGWIPEDEADAYPWANGSCEGDVHGQFVWRNRSWEHANAILRS
jgi:hypothetical protein